MAGSPAYKVFNRDREYIAACKHVQDAACLCALWGEGATIKHSGRIVWREGVDGHAADSYDVVATHVSYKIWEYWDRKEHAV